MRSARTGREDHIAERQSPAACEAGLGSDLDDVDPPLVFALLVVLLVGLLGALAAVRAVVAPFPSVVREAPTEAQTHANDDQ